MTRSQQALYTAVNRSFTTISGNTSSSNNANLKFKFIKHQQNASFKLPLMFSHGLDSKSPLADKAAFIDYTGKSFSFRELADNSVSLAKEIATTFVPESQERVAFLCDRDFSFPTTLGAIWLAQHIAIPLSSAHPDSMLEYFLKCTSTKLLVTNLKNADRLNRVAKLTGSQLYVADFESVKNKENASTDTEKLSRLTSFNHSNSDDGAVILFTSGTTGKPKGVLLTHGNLKAQVENICGRWEVSERDAMLHVLPLHHTHGLIHAMLSPMAAGATCKMSYKFDALQTWQEFLSPSNNRPTIFTAVPTVFVKLIEEYDKSFANDSKQVSFVRQTCQEKMRVFLSGSASLPVPILEKFEHISGHRILERYGMTETGLILCNPLHGQRKPGFVGTPLESVKVAVADVVGSEAKIIAEADTIGLKKVDDGDKVAGDLLVKGPSVFREYWGNVEATRKEFTKDGWFITGDTVEYKDGSFKILGRKSVDIIKSGGYKLSALEIETVLLSLEEIKEVAVLGLSDPTWGQKVAALIVWNGKELTIEEIREIAKGRLPSYACPQVLKSLNELPRNHLGKVNKKELIKLF